MEQNKSFNKVTESILQSVKLDKCRKCECYKESLISIKNSLINSNYNSLTELIIVLDDALKQIKPSEYT